MNRETEDSAILQSVRNQVNPCPACYSVPDVAWCGKQMDEIQVQCVNEECEVLPSFRGTGISTVISDWNYHQYAPKIEWPIECMTVLDVVRELRRLPFNRTLLDEGPACVDCAKGSGGFLTVRRWQYVDGVLRWGNPQVLTLPAGCFSGLKLEGW